MLGSIFLQTPTKSDLLHQPRGTHNHLSEHKRKASPWPPVTLGNLLAFSSISRPRDCSVSLLTHFLLHFKLWSIYCSDPTAYLLYFSYSERKENFVEPSGLLVNHLTILKFISQLMHATISVETFQNFEDLQVLKFKKAKLLFQVFEKTLCRRLSSKWWSKPKVHM